MQEEQFRNKITWFTFFFSLLVIWVHSSNGELFLGKTSQAVWVTAVEKFFGDSIGQIAVPGFFLISSYLFYRNFHWNCLKSKWISRAKSILIPYFLWNIIYYLGYVIGSRIPFFSQAIGKGVIPFDFIHILDAVLRHRYLYVFWYLEQLILLILLAPVLYLLLKNRWSGLVFLGIVFCAVWMVADFPYLNEDALFYYGTGAFLALQGRQLEKSWKIERSFLGFILIGAGVLNLYFTRKYFLPGTTVLYRILVPLGLWMAVNERWLKPAKPWMNDNFFLYAIHFSFVRLFNKTAALLLPPLPAVPLTLYLAMPVLMTVISYRAASVLKTCFPRLWNVLNGGR